MKSKLKILIPVVLVAFGGTYKFVLAKPAPVPEPKVKGDVYVLPKEFVLNLADGRFAKVQVGLVIEPAHGEAGGAHGAPAEPPEGYGANPQEGLVRDIVTDTLTDVGAEELVSRKGREDLKHRLKERIGKHTDLHVEEVLLTDVTVQ